MAECPAERPGGAKMSNDSRGGHLTHQTRSNWLGRKDSNLRMGDPKSPALPLGDAPPKQSAYLQGTLAEARAITASVVSGDALTEAVDGRQAAVRVGQREAAVTEHQLG